MNTGQYTELINQLKTLNQQLNEIRLAVARIDGRLKEASKNPNVIVINGDAPPDDLRRELMDLFRSVGNGS